MEERDMAPEATTEAGTDEGTHWTDLDRRAMDREGGRKRRLRDRLADEGLQTSPLSSRAELRNALLLCDDDLRQTAQALGGIEGFVMAALRVLENKDVNREDVLELLQVD